MCAYADVEELVRPRLEVQRIVAGVRLQGPDRTVDVEDRTAALAAQARGRGLDEGAQLAALGGGDDYALAGLAGVC